MQRISAYRLPLNRTSRSISIRQYRVAVVEYGVKGLTKVFLSVYQFLATAQRPSSSVGIVFMTRSVNVDTERSYAQYIRYVYAT